MLFHCRTGCPLLLGFLTTISLHFAAAIPSLVGQKFWKENGKLNFSPFNFLWTHHRVSQSIRYVGGVWAETEGWVGLGEIRLHPRHAGPHVAHGVRHELGRHRRHLVVVAAHRVGEGVTAAHTHPHAHPPPPVMAETEEVSHASPLLLGLGGQLPVPGLDAVLLHGERTLNLVREQSELVVAGWMLKWIYISNHLLIDKKETNFSKPQYWSAGALMIRNITNKIIYHQTKASVEWNLLWVIFWRSRGIWMWCCGVEVSVCVSVMWNVCDVELSINLTTISSDRVSKPVSN